MSMNYPNEGVALGRSIVQMEPKGRGSGLCLKTEVSVRSRRYLVWAENPCHTSCPGPLEDAQSLCLRLDVFLLA